MKAVVPALAACLLSSCGYFSKDVRQTLDEPFPKKLLNGVCSSVS